MEAIQIKSLFDEILTFLTEENAAIAGSLDGIKDSMPRKNTQRQMHTEFCVQFQGVHRLL